MTPARGRYGALVQRLVDAVLATPGHTPSALRRAALARAAEPGGPAGDLPTPLANHIDTVALGAHRITDGDLAALRHAGSSEDAVFEISVAAAVGAALARLDRGLAALRGEEPA
jgi:alkylhydroperoxidase family enzyme